MGLHRNVQTRFNPVEQEVRKRIFWCVMKLDIYVGALLGLPMMLTDEDIDQEFPLEVDDDYITTERILAMPPDKPSLIAAFNAHTRIVKILAKTTRYIYPTKGGKSKNGQSYIVSHARIREIEQDLQNWFECLPTAFRPGIEVPQEFVRYAQGGRLTHVLHFNIRQDPASLTHGICSHRDDDISSIPALCYVGHTGQNA